MKLSYSIEEACTITGIGRTKLYEAINDKKLKARKYGKRTILLKEDLNSFLAGLSDYEPKEKGEKNEQVR